MSSLAQTAYSAGFGPLMCPVTRRGQPHSDRLDAEDMGKAPGVFRDGVWTPIGAPSASCDSLDMARRWDEWPANVGLCCGREAKVIALDNDADDPLASSAINGVLLSHVPFSSPVRGVDHPDHHRLLVPVRIKGDMPRGTSLAWEKDGKTVKLDVLAEGKQFVAWGEHARTGCAYTWNVDITAQIDGPMIFPEIESAQLGVILTEVDQALAGLGWTRVSGSTAGTAAGTTGTPVHLKTATEQELTRWLALLPNRDSDHQFDGRDTWVAMAHAIWAASEGADWGRELWLQWSNQRPQRQGEPEGVWDSIRESRVDLDWIRQKARERNPRVAAQLDFELAPAVDQDVIDAIVAGDLGGRLWPAMRQRWAFVTKQNQFVNIRDGHMIPVASFDMLYARDAARLQREIAPQAKKPMRPSQLFGLAPDRMVVKNLTYQPGQPKFVPVQPEGELLNLWQAPVIPYRPVSAVDVQPWLDHVEYVMGSKERADLLIKWFALLVRHPTIKANWHPLIVTKPGLGKDTMLKPVLAGVGVGNYRQVTAEALAEPYTDYRENRLNVVSEARMHGAGERSPHSVMNSLKEDLASPPELITSRGMYAKPYDVTNTAMWVFFSNERVPVYLNDTDRRFWVTDNFDAVKKDAAYFDALNAWMDAHPLHVANYLMQYTLTAADIQFFRGGAPDTPEKRALATENEDPVLYQLRQMINDAKAGAEGFTSAVVNNQQIRDYFSKKDVRLPGGARLARYLRSLGAFSAGKNAAGEDIPVPLPSGEKARLWVLAETDDQGRNYKGLPPAEYGRIHASRKWPTPRQTSTGVPLGVVEPDPIV